MIEHVPAPAEVKTTCPYCGVGCGMLARLAPDGQAIVRGDPDHPANFGRLCSKGLALPETLGLEGRLLHPEIDGREAGWEQALDLVAAQFSETIAKHGPDSVAFYVSGQLLTEDYYVANKLMKGFIGSANIDTNSRLCMASSVAGHQRAFGSDTVPGTYRDLELADLIVLVGSNLAWCHPVLYQRIAAAKEARTEMKVVLIDPRRTMTADIADMHLPIRADGDVALFAGLLAYLAEQNQIERAYVEAYTTGLEQALAPASRLRLEQIADQTGLTVETLTAFYCLFACLPAPRRSSPSTAKASTNPRRGRTRSTPSSTVISRRVASAGREWGRSRSPDNPTPWAAAKLVVSPICSQPIWRSRTLTIATACGASGGRPESRTGRGQRPSTCFAP